MGFCERYSSINYNDIADYHQQRVHLITLQKVDEEVEEQQERQSQKLYKQNGSTVSLTKCGSKLSRLSEGSKGWEAKASQREKKRKLSSADRTHENTLCSLCKNMTK